MYYYTEIKTRIILILLAWVALVITCYLNKEVLLYESIKPCINTSNNTFAYFISTDISEIFAVYIKLSYFLSNQITFIYAFLHLTLFILPALYKSERQNIKVVFLLFVFLWVIGIYVLHKMIIPFSWDFFTGFLGDGNINNQGIKLYFEVKILEYCKYYISIYYIYSVIIQVFIALFVFFDLLSFKLDFIKKYRKMFYFFFIAFATVTTPPDVTSQLLAVFIFIFILESMFLIVVLKIQLIQQSVN